MKGTKKEHKFWQHVRRDPKACPGGDCLCDLHEGKTDRLHTRAVHNRDLAKEIEEHLDENDLVSLDCEPGWCGDWCPCGDNLKNWLEWLRSQEVYPIPPLVITIGQLCLN
jgi:hypothetical protein